MNTEHPLVRGGCGCLRCSKIVVDVEGVGGGRGEMVRVGGWRERTGGGMKGTLRE